MKRLIRNIVNKAGFDIIRTKNNHGSFDVHLTNVFQKYSIDCVIDVGANSGQYGAFLRSMGFDGWIVSFEPVKSVFEKLTDSAKEDAKWICYNFALGDKPEKKIINVYSSSVFSSFLDASDYSKGIWKSLETVTPEEVTVKMLDDIFFEISERTGCHHFYLKLDTQGYDLNVFHGGLKSLTKVDAIQTELSLIHVYKEMRAPYEVLAEFNKHNYHISGMYPINRDESLAVIEYDCVLVKKLAQVDA
jgi:FkbM family methyltransferase